MTDGEILPNFETVGLIYSIIGLAGVIITSLFWKEYMRFFDYIQFMYVWAIYIVTPTGNIPIFSVFLDRSWLTFMPSYFEQG